jgi:hypothetical protein
VAGLDAYILSRSKTIWLWTFFFSHDCKSNTRREVRIRLLLWSTTIYMPWIFSWTT